MRKPRTVKPSAASRGPVVFVHVTPELREALDEARETLRRKGESTLTLSGVVRMALEFALPRMPRPDAM